MEEEEIKDEKKRDQVTKRNSIRETIKDCFYSHNCFYLPQPVEPQRLTELDKINEKDFDKEYIRKLDNLKSELNKIIRPKMINNQSLNGKQFSEYLKLIVDAINDEKVFYIHDAMFKIEAEEAFKYIKKEYEKNIKELNCPLKWNKFNKNEEEIFDSLCDYFKEKVNKAYVDEYLSKFFTFRLENFEVVFREIFKYRNFIDNKIKKINDKIASDLWESKIEPNIISNSIKFCDEIEFDRTIEEIKNELYTKCFELDGNTFEEFWQSFLEKKNYKAYKEAIIQIRQSYSRNFDPRNGNRQVGTISIAGEVRPLFEGPRGGLYHYPKSGKPSYVYASHRGIRFFKNYNIIDYHINV